MLAEGLLQDGLHVSEVADGYKKAAKKVRLLNMDGLLEWGVGFGDVGVVGDTWI